MSGGPDLAHGPPIDYSCSYLSNHIKVGQKLGFPMENYNENEGENAFVEIFHKKFQLLNAKWKYFNSEMTPWSLMGDVVCVLLAPILFCGPGSLIGLHLP